MQQAIIWTNANPIYWRIFAAVGGDELMSLPDDDFCARGKYRVSSSYFFPIFSYFLDFFLFVLFFHQFLLFFLFSMVSFL